MKQLLSSKSFAGIAFAFILSVGLGTSYLEKNYSYNLKASLIEGATGSWTVSPWGACQAGQQSRSVQCRANFFDVIDDSGCNASQKPAVTRSCRGDMIRTPLPTLPTPNTVDPTYCPAFLPQCHSNEITITERRASACPVYHCLDRNQSEWKKYTRLLLKTCTEKLNLPLKMPAKLQTNLLRLWFDRSDAITHLTINPNVIIRPAIRSAQARTSALIDCLQAGTRTANHTDALKFSSITRNQIIDWLATAGPSSQNFRPMNNQLANGLQNWVKVNTSYPAAMPQKVQQDLLSWIQTNLMINPRYPQPHPPRNLPPRSLPPGTISDNNALVATPQTGTAPQTISVKIASNDLRWCNYALDWDDGSEIIRSRGRCDTSFPLQTYKHTYSEPGVYKIKLERVQLGTADEPIATAISVQRVTILSTERPIYGETDSRTNTVYFNNTNDGGSSLIERINQRKGQY